MAFKNRKSDSTVKKLPQPRKQPTYVMMRLRNGKVEYVELTRKPDYARASGEATT